MIIKGKNINIGNFFLEPLDIRSKKDFDFFIEIFSDKEVMKTVSLYNGNIPTKQEIRQDFLKRSCNHKKYNLGSYKITNKNKDIIGITSLLFLKKDKTGNPQFLEFEYFLSPKFWNKRIGSDIAKILIDYGFKNFRQVKRIYATALINNIPSQIIMHRLGFKYVGKRQRTGAGLVNLRYITRLRFYFFALNLIRRGTDYYVKLINKLNNNSSAIKEYNNYNL
jgi:RimJ/RimL family protein N-acetyltransferase